MKKFLRNIILFILAPILLSYPLDILISNQLKKSNSFAEGEYSTWNDLYNGKINSDIVIYGSSRAWVHIDPELMEKSLGLATYNLGIDGHNFWLQYLRHKTLLKYNKKPKYIILSIDIWSLQKNRELYNSEQFLPYMLFNKDIINYTTSYKGFKFIDYYFPLIRFVGNINSVNQSFKNSLFFSKAKPKRIKGYEGQDSNWNNDLFKAKQKMNQYEAKLDIASIKLFNDFIIECKEKDIKVILVYTPEYVEGQKFVKNRKEIISLYKYLSEEHKIPFLDYSAHKICTKKEYFYNASHLNKEGAELFTNMLIKDLKEGDIIISPN